MNKTYKSFYITETPYHWGFEVVAIPDEGETIRLKMVDYTKAERVQVIKQRIDEPLRIVA
jgi:hypothetical protein